MKVLIVSANTVSLPDPVFPIGACYIASACKEAGFETEAFDCNLKEDVSVQLTKKLKEFCPDVIGLSLRNVDDCQFPNSKSFMPDYLQIMRICRKNSTAKVILGGTAFSLFPEKVFEYLQPDYGVVGDGEKSFIDLLQSIQMGQPREKIIFSAQLNLAASHLIPQRSFFDVQQYYHLGGMLNVQTKRGCAYRCSYCTYPYLEGFGLREKDPVKVADELEIISTEHGIKHVFFVDSVFNYPEKHALEICKEIIRRKIKIRWSAYIRPQMQDLAILEVMQEAGCKSIELGTDSMAEETLASMNKTLSIDEIFRFCEKCNELNIDFCHSLIFGAPGETEATVKKTVANVNLTNPTAVIAFVGIRIFPNTTLADYAVKSGYLGSLEEIGLEPVFYVDRQVETRIIDYLKEVLKRYPKWIIPGIEAFDAGFLKNLRDRNKKGMSWEMKKFTEYVKDFQ